MEGRKHREGWEKGNGGQGGVEWNKIGAALIFVAGMDGGWGICRGDVMNRLR